MRTASQTQASRSANGLTETPAKFWRTVVYCIQMSRPKTDSAVLTLRVPAKVHRYLTREARRRRQTRSDIARSILQERVDGSSTPDLLLEARRQSLLVSKRRSERETLAFLDAVVDRRGWK